jgi:hypothetical protein
MQQHASAALRFKLGRRHACPQSSTAVCPAFPQRRGFFFVDGVTGSVFSGYCGAGRDRPRFLPLNQSIPFQQVLAFVELSLLGERWLDDIYNVWTQHLIPMLKGAYIA